MLRLVVTSVVAFVFAGKALAFLPPSPYRGGLALKLTPIDLPAPMPPTDMVPSSRVSVQIESLSPLAKVGRDYISSSSHLVALQERRPPTPEEIAAKKRNFNLWFWGGGFVAPFLATFYYFG